MVTAMTVIKAVTIRRRSGAASSRLIQTFLREGKLFAVQLGDDSYAAVGVFYYLLISVANLVSPPRMLFRSLLTLS